MINPRIVLLGAGGSAMSAITRMLREVGYSDIIAIDQSQSQLTDELKKEGIPVVIGHGSINLDPSDVVISSAAAVGSIERNQSLQYYENDHVKSTPPLRLHEFLGELSKSMNTIAITGTHGKSTTTALAGKVFSDLDSNFGLCVLGAGLADRGGANYKLNPLHISHIKRLIDRVFSRKSQGVEDIWKKYTFLIEADEYNKHMLYYDPTTTLITTLSHDHVDIYPTQQAYFEAFRDFILKTKESVYGLTTDAGFQTVYKLLPVYKKQTITILPPQSFTFTYLIGGHNHANATLVYQVALDWGLPEESVRESLQSFKSLRRRAETLGKNDNGSIIISDYAHHPNELISTYHAIQEKYPTSPLHIIFQPHQAQRLLEFRNSAVETLKIFTNPIVYQIYAAREDIPSLLQQYSLGDSTITDGESLGRHFSEQGGATYISTEKGILNHINSIHEGIIVLFTAGNLDYVVRNSLKR